LGDVPESHHAVDDHGPITPTNHTHINTFSSTDIIWILAGVWSSLFLGALDGKSTVLPNVRKVTCLLFRHRCGNTHDSDWQLL
jgi:hypothetical protein